MEISALTRSVVKRNHAVIAPDGYINSNVPGWTDCTVNVIINEAMGANLCQTLITLNKNGKLIGQTKTSQIFFYIVKGKATAIVGGTKKIVTQGQFVYVPTKKGYKFENLEEGTQILTFHKVYEKLDGHAAPQTI